MPASERTEWFYPLRPIYFIVSSGRETLANGDIPPDPEAGSDDETGFFSRAALVCPALHPHAVAGASLYGVCHARWSGAR